MVHSWLTSALWKGWKKNFEPSDVYGLNHSEQALTVSNIFEKHWKSHTKTKSDADEMEMRSFSKQQSSTRKEIKSVTWPLLKTIGPCLITGAVLQVLSDVSSFASPLLLGFIIDYSTSEEPSWIGILYACLFGLAGVVQSLLQEGSAIFHTKLGLRLKSATMNILYKKTFRLTSGDTCDLTMGEILNTMYVDTNRFQILSPQLGLLWSVPVQLVLCFVFMYQELGYSAFAGIVPIAVLVPLNYIITKKSKYLQIELMKLKDERMKIMNEILNGIRVLKLYAWERSFQSIILKFRKKEIVVLKKQAFFQGINLFIYNIIPTLGINLSGGQKQRVNLARAIHRDDDVYLLDDPLGAVDSHVAKHLFNKVIGPNGFLKNKTRVLVTHNLSFIREVDKIFFMNNGRIIDSGTYDEIMSRQGIARKYFAEHINKEDTAKQCKLNTEVERFHLASKKNVSNENDAKLTTKETLIEGRTSLAAYKQYFQAFGMVWCVLTVFTLTISAVFQISSVYWLSLWCADTKEYVKANPGLKTTRIVVTVFLGLGSSTASCLNVIIIAFCSLRAANILHAKMLESVSRSPMSFFDTTPIGRILNRFSQDIDALDQQLATALRLTVFSSIFIVLNNLANVIFLPLFIIPCVSVLVGYILLQRFLMSSNRQLKRITSEKNSFLFSHVGGSVAGTIVIKACEAKEYFERRFLKLIDECTAPNYMMNMAQRWLTVRFNLLGNFLLFCTGLFIILSKETLSTNFVGMIMANADQALQFIKSFIAATTSWEINNVSVERVHEYCHLESEAEWEKPQCQPPPNWPHQGQILFRNYSTKYREGLDLVLKDIDVKIEAGEKVGVVGRTGAGKSSLTLVLFRLLESIQGQIVIDGVDVKSLGLFDLRSRLTIIPQDPVVFSGTIRLNLDPFGKQNDQRLWAALEHSHMKSFVASLEQGLDHPVAEGGHNLSVGQRQLVCLARALLRNTKILILDEATASVDMDTDDLIQETIRKDFTYSTIITIAHRINTILDYDKVMVLDQGRIVEFNSPQALLKNEQSLFYELVKDSNLL